MTKEWNSNQVNADIALKNRLYVSGWMLSSHLKAIRDGKINSIVKLQYEDGKPVGVVTMNRPYEGFDPEHFDTKVTNVEIFVKKAYRKKGIGRKLIAQLENCPKLGGWGVDGSQRFWKKVGVGVRY